MYLWVKHNCHNKLRFLGAFAKLRETTISFVKSPWNNWAPTGRTFMKFCILVCLENLSRKFKFHLNLRRLTVTLHEDLGTVMIVSRSVLLRVRNAANNSCWEIKTCILITFSENRALYEIMWRKYGTAGQATDDNMAHALCSLGN